MLTDEDKLELFDGLLRDALTLADALQERVGSGGFSELRTAWKNVHAARTLLDSESAPRADHDKHHFTCTWSIRGRRYRGACACAPDLGTLINNAINTWENVRLYPEGAVGIEEHSAAIEALKQAASKLIRSGRRLAGF